MEQEINKKSKKPFFTVFIGLYNSEEVIHRFFKSALQQTFRDFELIIIDDASKDDTVNMVNEFIPELSGIKVTFIKHKENKGIAYSRNEALDLGNGEVFVKWDHDDVQDENQLLEFYKAYTKYNDKNIAAVWCLCKGMDGEIVGNKYNKNYMIGTYFSMYSKYILSTINKPRERHNCINLKVHKEIYRYLHEEDIIPENTNASATDIWCALAMLGYKTVYINKPLRQYFIENTRPRMSNSGRNANAERVFLDRITWINHYMKYLDLSDFSWRIRLYLSVNQYGLISGKSLYEILTRINGVFDKLIVLIFFIPVKILISIRDRK